MAEFNENNITSGSYVGIAHEVFVECGFKPSRIEIVGNQTADSYSVWFSSMTTNCAEVVVDVQIDATGNVAVSDGQAPYKELLGTVAVTTGTRTVTGTNTHFLTQLVVGDEILLGGNVYSVATITSDTAATIETPLSTATIATDVPVRVTGRGPGFTVAASDSIRNNAGDTYYWCAQR